jgi:hypothetical protein
MYCSNNRWKYSAHASNIVEVPSDFRPSRSYTTTASSSRWYCCLFLTKDVFILQNLMEFCFLCVDELYVRLQELISQYV